MQLYLDTPVAGSASPLLSPGTTALFQKYYGLDADRFRQEKADSNKFVLERLPGIRKRIETTQDPLFTALQFAILGNYIDFSALQGELTFEKLDEMLKNAENMDLDRETYHRFREKLGKSQRLLYLTDNAGEIGFDPLLGEELQSYPGLASPSRPGRSGGQRRHPGRAALMELPFPAHRQRHEHPRHGAVRPGGPGKAGRGCRRRDPVQGSGQRGDVVRLRLSDFFTHFW